MKNTNAIQGSAFLLERALELLTQCPTNDEERAAVVQLFERWNPAQFLTLEDALKLREAVMNDADYAGWRDALVAPINAEIRGDIQ